MEWVREMVEKLNNAQHGEAGQIMRFYSNLTGKSVATLYRIAHQHGYIKQRKKRSDKGILKSGVSEYQLHYISTLLQTTARQVKGVIMTVEKALEIAIDNGIFQPGQISVSRLQDLLRERGLNKEALDAASPSINMRSEHPNQVHIFDASICIQYYLKKGKGLAILDERDFREKKPQNFAKIKHRLIRMVLVDHFSGALFVKYYLAAGESSAITYDFLCTAWRGLGLEKFPFRGVPKFLLMDAGSANIAKSILAMLKALEIEIPKNMPHNPRRQGAAEVAQNIVERCFECTLHLEPAYEISELNEWVQDWLVAFNGTKVFTRHKMTRIQCWLQIQPDQLRELPSQKVMQELFAYPLVERTVQQDNSISFKSDFYSLKHVPGIRPKLKVHVRRRPYLKSEIAVIFEEKEYLVQPVEILPGGFRADAALIGQEYKSQPENATQKARKINENLAFGEDRKKGDLPFGGTLIVHGHQADKVKAIPIPKIGSPLELKHEMVSQQISITEFFKKLKAAIGPIKPDLNKALRAEFGTSIEVSTAEEVIAAISAGESWRKPIDLDRQAL